MPEGKEAEFFYKQIGITAEDNLKILEKVREIIILPLRLLNQINANNLLFNIGEKVFVSLFNGIESLSDYFSKCISIDDIKKYARDDIEKLIMFSEDDNPSLAFEERFKVAMTEMNYMIDKNQPDSINFWVLVYSCIQQAIDVIISCVEYGCIPYIRYPVSLHYISLISKNMLEIEHITTLRFKMSVAFVVYKLCDKNRLATVCLDEFLQKNQEYGFSAKLFSVLDKHGINEKSFFTNTISQLVIDELEDFYRFLSGAEDNNNQ